MIIAIYALITWYGFVTTAHLDTPPIPTRIAIVLIALGITGSIYNMLTWVVSEVKGAIMVLAEFLNRTLLEPQKRRLIDEGRALGRDEGRDEAIAEIRSRLREKGIDPDDIIPPEKPGKPDRS